MRRGGLPVPLRGARGWQCQPGTDLGMGVHGAPPAEGSGTSVGISSGLDWLAHRMEAIWEGEERLHTR